MKIFRRSADRRCLFNEYKEWLGESIDDEVLAIPTDLIQMKKINKEDFLITPVKDNKRLDLSQIRVDIYIAIKRKG